MSVKPYTLKGWVLHMLYKKFPKNKYMKSNSLESFVDD